MSGNQNVTLAASSVCRSPSLTSQSFRVCDTYTLKTMAKNSFGDRLRD